MLIEKDKSDLLVVLPKMEKTNSILIPIAKTATFEEYFQISEELERLIGTIESRAVYEMKAVSEGIRIWRIQ